MGDNRTRISENDIHSRMLDSYDWMMGKMLQIGAYSGKQKERNQFTHRVLVPYIREHHPEYVPSKVLAAKQ